MSLSRSNAMRRSFRLRQVMAMLTSLVVAVVVLFSGISFDLLQRHLENLRVKENYEHLSIAQDILAQRLQFYQDLLQSYAADIRVRDLVSFGDQPGAVTWSSEVRSALPQAVGAALFTADGEILGDPLAQRVGDSCIDELREDLARLGSHHENLHLESRTDALTELANRRVFDEGLARLLNAREPTGAGFCVVLLDLDDFKAINDRYGHGCGDLVLKALASALNRVARDSDLASRWGAMSSPC